jgi:hypothetical protein
MCDDCNDACFYCKRILGLLVLIASGAVAIVSSYIISNNNSVNHPLIMTSIIYGVHLVFLLGRYYFDLRRFGRRIIFIIILLVQAWYTYYAIEATFNTDVLLLIPLGASIFALLGDCIILYPIWGDDAKKIDYNILNDKIESNLGV